MSRYRADTQLWPKRRPGRRERDSYADAEPRSFWIANSPAREPAPPLEGVTEAELTIVGGGLTGLWAAVVAKERDPARDIVLLEGERIAFGASGRNGGFISSSLTHGISNGLARVPDEMQMLERLGLENYNAIGVAIKHFGIECDFIDSGSLTVALTPTEENWLADEVEELHAHGHRAEFLGTEAVRAQVNSPTYRTGLWHRSGEGTIDPVKLCLGLRRVAVELGVRIHEHTRVTSIERTRRGVDLVAGAGTVQSRGAVLATAAFPGLVKAIRTRIVPVYDYVLITEPLSTGQLSEIGWDQRQGVGDSSNQFHYYRLTADNRILWGGYDAIYNYGNGLGPHLDQRDATFARLAQHFFITFPQLEGLRFSHRWGGAIDACSRFSAFYGRAYRGRVTYAVGHTGLGVGASRFAGGVALDLLDHRPTKARSLRYVRRKPLPFPPEPLRWGVIQLTRNRLAAADRHGGKRGVWLRLLDRHGLGFDS